MGTTKEAMKVIAKGLDENITVQITEHEEEYGLSDVEELAEQIVFEIAEKTGADFVLFAEEADPECIDLVIKLLENRFFSSFTHALRTIFLAEGWVDAVWRLDLLDICYEHDEAAYDLFYDYFFTSEALTGYRYRHYSDEENRKDNGPNTKLN